MLDKKTVSQCISADYCRGWNDAVDEMPRWISVEEKFPNIDEEVLICTKEGLYDVAQYTGADRFWTLERNPSAWVTAMGVTHWSPFPSRQE